MQPPQFLLDLLQLLLDLAVPAAFCTLAAAGVSLRHEGGVNFHVNGRTGKWVLWTIVLLTLPQLLSWIAAQGINIPSGERVGGHQLAGKHGDGLQELRQPDRCREVGAGDCGLFRPEGNTRWRGRRESAWFYCGRALPDVSVGHDATDAGLELGRSSTQ